MKTKLLLLSGTGISRLGDFMYIIALTTMVLKNTNSPAAVAGLALVSSLATVCTKFWSGSIVDRLNKRSIMIVTDIIRAIFICCIPFFHSIWPIYLFIFLTRIAASFFDPASLTYRTMLIPCEERAQFNAWNNFFATGAVLVGPALAGSLMFVYSPQIVIYCNSISFLISALLIYFLPNITLQGEPSLKQTNSFLHTLQDDWRQIFLFAKTKIYIILIFSLFQMTLLLSMALDSQEGVFIMKVLHQSETAYSMLVSITGLAYVLGSFLVSLVVNRIPIQYSISIGTILTAVGYIIFAVSHSFLVAASGFIILGIFSSFANTGFLTFYQNNIPLEMMGRIDSAFDSIKNLIQIFFIIIIGVLAEFISIRYTIIGSALLIFFFSCMLGICVMLPSRNKHYVTTESSLHY
ncbi:MFS transporter [Bacillus gaemokensis]|uniref:Permease n=1 Tax=Bacillus gaemokensis TaxID=574375 RepID=A0A073KBP1_9BACI|nr:MFS transporter [Bacillus gaemokensis]KEK24704.1 permease [Bacillus gaemokensis]KYG34525.1 permease [Bacillus gaemokensis]